MVLLAVGLLMAAGPMATLASAAPGDVGRYIVVLKDDVADPAGIAAAHGRAHGAAVGFVYSHALKGYSAAIPKRRLAALAADPRVKYVEPDGEVTAAAQTVPWGITQVGATVDSTVAGDGTGAVVGPNVYIIDTGIDMAHTDLNVVEQVNFADRTDTDCNGHGTHVAGTAAAKDNAQDVVGVAPGARLHAVKVLNCRGSGSSSRVIKGIDWVTANHQAGAVANMSLSGSPSQSVDDAVRSSVASGVLYAVAAGNQGDDACNYSPARVGSMAGVVTVGATFTDDRVIGQSNWGPCVDMWAPGGDIVSTALGGGTTSMSGTSMASPHVAGGAALVLARSPSSMPAAVEAALKSSAALPGTSSQDGRAVARLDVRGF
jgi:subtilisin family serine protease